MFGASQRNFLVDSPAAVAQAVLTALKLWYAEFYLDTTDGTPWLEGVLGIHDQASADSTIRTRILGIQVIVSSKNVPNGLTAGQLIPGVNSIDNFASQRDDLTRAYSAACLLNTIYGPTQLEIQNYPNF